MFICVRVCILNQSDYGIQFNGGKWPETRNGQREIQYQVVCDSDRSFWEI